MGDYIKREDAIKRILQQCDEDCFYCMFNWQIDSKDYCAVKDAFEDIPGADVVGVVRCKYCKHRQDDVGMGDHRWCDILNGTTRPNDSCPYGERIESEE